jgi:hypothetical protein
MKDSIVKVTITGIIAAIFMSIVVYLFLLFGLEISTPWEIAADVFLVQELVLTPIGTLLGFIGTIALNIASAGGILLILIWTGFDYPVLKGIVVTNAMGFGGMGLFMPLLKIYPQIQNEPLTNLAALFILTLTGALMGYILNKYRIKNGRTIYLKRNK